MDSGREGGIDKRVDQIVDGREDPEVEVFYNSIVEYFRKRFLYGKRRGPSLIKVNKTSSQRRP